MPSRARRARSQAARHANRVLAADGYRNLAAVEARRAELVAAATAAAGERRRALAIDDADAAATATAALVAAAAKLSAAGMRSELAAVLGVPEGELRRLLRSARGRNSDG